MMYFNMINKKTKPFHMHETPTDANTGFKYLFNNKTVFLIVR